MNHVIFLTAGRMCLSQQTGEELLLVGTTTQHSMPQIGTL